MNIFVLNAGGFYAIGTAVVAAETIGEAVSLANNESDSKWELTYHGMGGNSKHPIGTTDTDTAHVMNIHEWGMPHLPSKGSGQKVTF